MSSEELDDVVDARYSREPPTTEQTKETIRRFQDRCRSSVRIATGRVMEDDVFKEMRNKNMKNPLP